MPRTVSWCVLAWLLTSSAGLAQVTDGNGRKQATAMRVAPDAVDLDGRLDEHVWGLARGVVDFVQKEPSEGAPPTDRMDVRFVYTDSALYVGARMYSSEGVEAIQAPMGRRDDVGQSEYLLVALDTYLDRRTAYCFGVTASGVRLDHYHRADIETDIDVEFDPVWEARVRVDREGWTAEMWIPFSQLRFNESPIQVWGLNLHRWIPTRNEDDYWVPVPRTVQGWASRFGELRGVDGVRPTRRVELLPYVVGNSTIMGNRDRANPFDDGRNLEGQVGIDLKMGLGPNLTLDATVNPDFGQVEADPAVVNLTAYEVFFTERRPFFIEGSRLLNTSIVNNYFYSRRIGGPPVGSAQGDYVDYPRRATILGAAKLTGRLASGTSIGILGAVTGQEHARTFTRASGSFGRVRVAPPTGWGVARIQQEFGPAGSTAGLMFTGVHRALDQGEPLAGLLTRNAISLNGDTLLRLKGGEYELGAYGAVSYVDGDAAAILRLQQASTRYMQRPDATHVTLNPTRTSMAGFKAGASADRVSGRHWLWSLGLDIESPELELNDIGRITAGDGMSVRPNLSYRETVPGRMFRNYRVTVNGSTDWDFGGERTLSRAGGSFAATWTNFWTSRVSMNMDFRGQDWRLTRGGPLMESPRGWTTSAELENRASAESRWNGTLTYARDEFGGVARRVQAGFSVRPGPSWQLSVAPIYERLIDPRQYVTTQRRGRPDTYGSRYIFAFIDRTTLSTQARLSITFKPDVNLDVYAEPFAASGRYDGFGELLAARSRFLRGYGTDGTTLERLTDGSRIVRDGDESFVIANPDFNVRSFRSTTVLRWEWRPGSTLYVVWQQDRSGVEARDARVGLGDMFGSLTAPGNNFFAIKASFWLAR